jgi:hypothetical protein
LHTQVLMHGPPLSSKSILGAVIARQYTLPHITAKYLIDVVLKQVSTNYSLLKGIYCYL